MKKFYRAVFGPDDTSVPGASKDAEFEAPTYEGFDDELNDLLDDNEVVEKSEDPSEPEGEETPKDDPNDPDESTVVEEDVKEEKPEEIKAEPEPEPEVKPDPVVPQEKNELELLREQVSTLSELVKSFKKDESSATVETKPAVKTPEEEVKELFESLDLDEVMDSRDKFAEFMLKFASVISKGTLNNVQSMKHAEVYQSVHDKFYERHKPLSHIKQYVGQVAEQVYAENPNRPLDEVLEETADKVYKTLGIKREEEASTPPETPAAPTPPKPPKPSLPGSKSTRVGTPKTTGLIDEIEELIND